MQTADITSKKAESLIQEGWGARLKQERKRLAYTQAEIAKLSGVSVVTYQQYEREEFEPRLGYLNQLANLEVSIRFVMFGELDPLENDLANSEHAEIMALNLLKEHLNKNPGKDIPADRLFALFDFFRSEFKEAVRNETTLPVNLGVMVQRDALSQL